MVVLGMGVVVMCLWAMVFVFRWATRPAPGLCFQCEPPGMLTTLGPDLRVLVAVYTTCDRADRWQLIYDTWGTSVEKVRVGGAKRGGACVNPPHAITTAPLP